MDINICHQYSARMADTLNKMDWGNLIILGDHIRRAIRDKKRLFVCGNGGSLGNAMHIANDFLYPISKQYGVGVRVAALGGNPSTMACIANDEGYQHVFSYELAVQGDEGDILLVLSGSGNSANILDVIETAHTMNITSYGILGFNGGKALNMVNYAIHTPINDMQICEDMQMICMNMIMQAIYKDLNN